MAIAPAAAAEVLRALGPPRAGNLGFEQGGVFPQPRKIMENHGK